MFDRLNAISWTSLEKYNLNGNVPNLIMGLFSVSVEIRSESLDFLCDLIGSDYTLYDMASDVVSVLIDLLHDDSLPDKHLVLNLLGLAAHNKYMRTKDLSYQVWAQKVHHAAHAGIPVYLHLVVDPNPQIRLEAAFTLYAFKTDLSVIAPALLAQTRMDENPDNKAVLGWYLAKLAHENTDFRSNNLEVLVRLFEGLIQNFEHQSTRISGAMGLALVLNRDTPSSAVNILVEAIATDTIKPVFTYAYSLESVCFALWQIGVDRGLSAFKEALDNATTVKHSHRIVMILIDTAIRDQKEVAYYCTPEVFRDGSSEKYMYHGQVSSGNLDVGSLSESHRRVLMMILNSKKVWEIPSNLLEVYGLPASPDELRVLLSKQG